MSGVGLPRKHSEGGMGSALETRFFSSVGQWRPRPCNYS